MKLNWKQFGKDIRSIRAAGDLSVRDVAKTYRISPATISRADRGLPVKAEYFLILVSYFLDKDPRVYLK
jgi:transcriptional regulator with XRE-family HTH domain